MSFAYTGASQTYTVPAGVVTLQLDAIGGQGGGGAGNPPFSASGRGGRVQATLSVTPGEVLTIQVGGSGGSTATSAGSSPAGYNGGGLGWNASGGPELMIAKPRHNRVFVVGLADGSVQQLRESQLNTLRWDP